MALIELITSPTCPHCLMARDYIPKAITKLSAEGVAVEFAEYSTARPEGAQKVREYGISTVPSVIVVGEKAKLLLESYTLPNLRDACAIADGRK